MTDDIERLVEQDKQKFQQYSGQGFDTSVPAVVELAFGVATALLAVVWFLSLLWVPDVIDGTTWMALGMLGLILLGTPAGVIYLLRRGGADTLQQVIRGVTR